jgi:membrane fusion protein (multidrug efflux system)
MYASTHEDTDDAYVTGYTHQISSRIIGTVEQVLVDDNWHVTAGQPLLKLDPRDYQVALEKDRASYLQAQAQLLQASAQIPLAEAQLAQAQAQADSSKANSDYLQRTFDRDSQLFYQGRGVISKQDLDTAQSQAETSVATYKATLAAVNVARENLKVAHAQEDAARALANAAQAQVKNSELQLSYCTTSKRPSWKESGSANRPTSKSMRSRTTGSRDGLTACSPAVARISPCFRRTTRLATSSRLSNAYR